MLTFIIIIVIMVCLVVLIAFLFGSWGRPSTYEYYTPEDKGVIGEDTVAEILGGTKEGEQYLINNLLFVDKHGRSRQIDHVFINRAGIWVIETKNFAGIIYGTEEQREWAQILPYNNEEKRFYNPVKQNLTHIYCLAELIKVNKNYYHNIVVFLGRADIFHVEASEVINISELAQTVDIHPIMQLTTDEMSDIYNKIILLISERSVSKSEHIANIHEMQKKVENGICPRCGGKLVVRKGRYGEFYGCSNYPKCKFKKNID